MIGTLLRHAFPFFLSNPFSTAKSKPSIHRLLLPFRTKHLKGFSFSRILYHSYSTSLQSQSVNVSCNSSDAVQTPSSSSPRLDFQLFNTMTKQKEVFKPKDPGKVGMYVCGVTAYDLSHIGHARVYVAFDVLYRSVLSRLLRERLQFGVLFV